MDGLGSSALATSRSSSARPLSLAKIGKKYEMSLYNYSTCRTNRVLTRSIRRVRVYALGAPTTRLRVWCTSEALTNQGGGVSVYRPRSLLHTIDSHHRLNEHTILYVFRAPRHDSPVPLSWYK